MGWNDRYGYSENTKMCPNCKKIYRQVVVNQVIGFREEEFDTCPYCRFDIRSSMDVEYINSRIDD